MTAEEDFEQLLVVTEEDVQVDVDEALDALSDAFNIYVQLSQNVPPPPPPQPPPVEIPTENVRGGPRIVWDKVGDRKFESGLDRGVLYLSDGSAVAWNGLTSVIEAFDRETSPVYYDGMKINDLIVLGDFSASMKAVTYPDEFLEFEGLGEARNGVFLADQPSKSFGLCYRTQIGNDLEGPVTGYKIHILYNVTAIPHEKTYASFGEDPSLVEFEWDITAVPEEIPGFRPTAHIIINSTDLDPWLLEEVEEFLYGSSFAEASLIPMADLMTYIKNWYRVKIIDNGDGTWTATTVRNGFISFLAADVFQIANVNAVYLDENTFEISDTIDISDLPQIKIIDNGDGTWSAVTDNDTLITIDEFGVFEIRNATVDLLGPDSYRISDTVEN
jgi:hypothetical protein